MEENTVVVDGLPETANEAEIRDFFNAALFTILELDPVEEEGAHALDALPVTSCTRVPGARFATLYLRLPAAVSLAKLLNGVEFQGVALQLQTTGPKAADSLDMEKLDTIDPVQLLGLQAKSSTKVGARKATWCEGGSVETELRARPLSHYEVLQVLRNAGPAELRGAFLKQCRASHDKSSNAIPLHQLQTAFKTLSDPSARSSYDHGAPQFLLDALQAYHMKDLRPAIFLLRHLKKMKEGLIKRVAMAERHGEAFLAITKKLRAQSRGADVLVVASQKGLPSEVWIAGNRGQAEEVQLLLRHAADEVDGRRAPPDGVVLHVPPALQSKIPDGEERTQLCACIQAETGSTVTFCEERMVVRGGNVPRAVAMLQNPILFRGTVRAFDGTELDGWAYSLMAEQNSAPDALLCPEREPDREECEGLLRRVCGLTLLSLMDMADKVLDGLLEGQVRVSLTVIRILVSDVVHHEVAQLDLALRAKFVSGLVRLWIAFKLQRRLGKFAMNPILRVLWHVPNVIGATQMMVVPAITEQLQAVVHDGWTPWAEVLPAISGHLWRILETSAAVASLQPDASWAQQPAVALFMLPYLCSHAFHIAAAGVQRKVANVMAQNQWFAQYAAAMGQQAPTMPAPGPLPAGPVSPPPPQKPAKAATKAMPKDGTAVPVPPPFPGPPPAMGLAQAAGKNLKQLQKSPVILKAVEQGSISESLMLAQLFSEQNLASGAVFAVSAAQLLRLLDAERAAFGEVLVHLRNALKLLKPGLLQMPGLVDSIAAYQPLRDIVKSARTNDLLLTEVCGYLLSQHHQAAPFPPEQVRILDQLSSTKRSWTLEEIEDKACFHQAMRGVKRELGPLWLEALLLQSKSWQWTGGRNWVRKPSNDPAVALAEELCNVPMQNRGLIPTRLPKIALLMRVVGASEELACLPGLYAITGNHDGRPVYQRFVPAQEQAVRIYWWQEDSTWWIGPEVGGDLVWASNRSSGSVAPRRNWNWEANAPLAQNSVIKAFHVEASTEAKPPPVVRPAPEREGANARTKKILLVKDPHASGKVAKQGSKQEQDLHTAGAGHVSGEKAQSPKRQRVAEASDPKRAKHLKDGAEQLKNWLASFDGSGSFLNMYLKALSSNFDDLCQVRAAFNNIPNAPPLKRIDPAFFTVIGVEKTGHKLTFAKKIAELQAS
ncbi:unnamed protein product [Effrenium voratum]|uniref:J domain-containing protein n=1 Tax=Effrenium voratum TaxID=2562239 RepID=A0AA36JP86_9DINO|nr:unnamed protein product [Effrenium voratum]